ncbi:family 78 glycoside hydrolase catalytic domain [Pedobacter sp. HDW13]|uniref:glycoside hydrolase family 78 protein n=1 Tax=Pedobacter sp. HDW13 TaxID=2714940 RepID=UPI00140BCB4C|nr:glycoside hydrolase family 78 protein [Pedobacter sp. HDW13]QIL40758.1 family 78 glycoside hydrolase catalytic domain [Pedobacter sp. HDW13]
MNKILRAPGALCTLALLFSIVTHAVAQKIAVKDLTVEHLVNPFSIDNPKPRFSWKLVSAIKGTKQNNYEIRLGTSATIDNKALWKANVSNDQSVLVSYDGPQLSSKTRYYWQVRVKDNHGNTSAWSPVQYFQTGLKPEDWSAKWIAVDGKDTTLASPMFRKEINLKKDVRSAMAYITAKGLYQAELNGKRISNAYFAPGWTSYKNHIQYQAYELGTSLKKGANVIGVSLGDGWYKGRIGFGWQKQFYGDTRALLLQLDVVYTDGTKETIVTDNSWKSNYGPIRAANIYDGENYDARLEIAGWNNIGYKETADWKPVRTLENGPEKLVGMSGPQVTKHEEFKALKIFKTPLGETVVDFGQNLVGWVMLKAKGPAGTKITISHAEVLTKAGNFYTTNLRTAKQQNNYTLKGGDEQVFEPHFTFQGFRYAKIDGYPGELKLDDLTAVAVYSDMQTSGKFSTSNPLLNQLQHNISWGQKGNFVDVPTDCPQRDERLGWTGDAQAFANTAAYNMDVSGFFTKWLKDVAADQLPSGSVPFVVPNVLNSTDAGSAGWADVATIIPWDLYVVYADKGLLETQYGSMKKWVDYISSVAKNNLWNSGFHFGDWLFYRPNDDNDGRAAVTDKYMIAQTFYAHSTQLLINAAKVLGKTDDVTKYSDLLAKIKAAYLAENMTANGKLISNTQTAYVLALQFDMLPENLRAQAAQRLVDNVRDYGNHLTTGFLGTPYLCHVLSRFGHENVAYDLLMQEKYPSWLYPVKMGATTIWERWDGIKQDGSFQTADMNSFNHYAYGAIGDWMYKNITGINPVVAQPGYKAILIAPRPGGNLTSASAELETVYGTVKSSWILSDGVFKLDVVVPANATATVVLPKTDKKEEIGSGSYHFETKY